MSIYAIGDLHLSFNENKPMDIFGENWEGHEEKIKKDWLQKVNENDLVLLPGDFSWSMYLENTYDDFKYLNELPGKKLLLKGNHDYWWTTLKSMRTYLEENDFKDIDFLHNNSYEYEENIIAGTRGWNQSEDSEDKRFVEREVGRLELSIKDGIEKYGKNRPIIVNMHYPPITNYNMQNNIQSPFIEVMKKYNVKKCIYGHLHGMSINDAIEGEHDGIELKLVSCDSLNFNLWKVQ